MSQKNATCSELVKPTKKFKANNNNEDKDILLGNEVRDNAKVTTSQDSIKNSSEMNDDDTVEDADEIEGPETAVFGNYVLLKLIGENMDFATLKTVRSLNSFCEEILTPQLLNKSCIVLEAATKSEDGLEVVKNLKGITDLRIRVKLLNKSYKPRFGLENEGEPKLFTKIFEKLSPSLKALELNHYGMPLPSPSIQFPLLSTLTIGRLRLEKEADRRLLQFVYASAPNLNALVFLRLWPHDFSPISPFLLEDGSRNWALAPKLKSLTIYYPLFPDDLQALVNFPQTWEALDIGLFPVDGDGDGDDEDVYENVGRLLENNKDSLVNLRLAQDEVFPFPPGQNTLRLPKKFPKLQKLSLDCWALDCKLSCGWSGIIFSQTFPALTSLSMDLGYIANAEYWDGLLSSRLWTSLFPPQVFKGLKYLKLSYVGVHQEEGIVQDWAARIFPNSQLEIKINQD